MIKLQDRTKKNHQTCCEINPEYWKLNKSAVWIKISVIPQQLVKYFCSAHRIKAENVHCLNPLCWHAELQLWELVHSPNIFRVQLKTSRTAKCLNECVLLFHTNWWNNIVTVTNGPFNTHTHWCIVCVFSLWCYLICSEFSSQHFYLSSPRRPCWSCAVSQFHSWRLCFMRPWTFPGNTVAALAPTHSNSQTVFMLTVSPSP